MCLVRTVRLPVEGLRCVNGHRRLAASIVLMVGRLLVRCFWMPTQIRGLLAADLHRLPNDRVLRSHVRVTLLWRVEGRGQLVLEHPVRAGGTWTAAKEQQCELAVKRAAPVDVDAIASVTRAVPKVALGCLGTGSVNKSNVLDRQARC